MNQPPQELKKLANLRTWLNDLRKFAISIQPLPGPTCNVFPGANGTMIYPAAQGIQQDGVISPAAVLPFQILPVTAGDSPTIGVYEESTVFKNLSGDSVAITGLYDGSTGSFYCPAIGSKIWLQIGTADPADSTHALKPWAATTQIKYGTVGSSGSGWNEYPDPVAINTDDTSHPYQEFYNLLLAEVTDPEVDTRPALMNVAVGTGDTPEIRQITRCWSNHVFLTLWIINGALCLAPVDPTLDQIPTPL